MNQAFKPVLQSLLVAERIYTDRDTGKKIIAGVFSQLLFMKKSFEEVLDDERVRKFGYNSGSPFGYACLTDVEGEQDFEIRYVDLSTDTVVFLGGFKVNSPDRLNNIETSFPLPPLPTDSPGVFALEILWNSELLGSYRIVVAEMPGKKDGK